jgi:hypothetical protein
MRQIDIDVMDRIVDELGYGRKISEALATVYVKRSVAIPYKEDTLKVLIANLGLSGRTSNALLRTKLFTLNDVVEFTQERKITEVKNFGVTSGIEVFETILDICWDNMTEAQKTDFLIDTVIRNSENIRDEFR